jgi:nicotinamide-nucleotide amidase
VIEVVRASGPNVRIIAVGDELLEGRTSDTNSTRIERALGGHAVQVSLIQVVPDREDDIARALDRSTPDDLTRDVVARWGGVDLVPDASLFRQLEERWKKRGLKSSPGAVRQSEVPVGLTPLVNPVGSAPGLVGTLKDRTLVLLPGVPQELQGLLPLAVVWLDARNILPGARPILLWRTAQIAELALVRKLEDICKKYGHLEWSWWLTDWGVDVRLAGPASGATEDGWAAVEKLVTERLGHHVYARSMDSLPEVVQARMLAAGATLSVAESCTAGMIGARLTDAPGSSGFFRGGILAYADRVKNEQLGVDGGVLAEHGAVSRETVEQMASGCRERLGTDYAVAVSGISGPDGGTADKPVGTTWIAVATGRVVFSHRYRFPANRERNRLLTMAAAVDSVRRVLEFGDREPPWRDSDTWCRPS